MKSVDDSVMVQAVCQDHEPCEQGALGYDEQFSNDCSELVDRLQAQWGITLWRLRVKGKQLKLKMEASQAVDELALRNWLTEQIGTGWEISIKFCAMSTCCGSGCRGCFIGSPTRDESFK